MLTKILALIGAGLIVFFMYMTVRNRPDLFSKENLNKAFGTMGFLGLLLIGFIALLVMLLRAT